MTIDDSIRDLGAMHPYSGDLTAERDELARNLESRLAPGKVYGMGVAPAEARKIGRRLLVRRLESGYEIDYARLTMSTDDDVEESRSLSGHPFGGGAGAFERRRVKVDTASEAAEIYLRVRRGS